MNQKTACLLSLALLGGSAVLSSCEKAAQPQPSPKVVQATQQLAIPGRTEKPSPAQLAWARFVDKVERGEQADPTGQYVSKATQRSVQPVQARAQRPKHDMASGVPAGLTIRASGTVAPTTGANLIADPDDPPVICPQGCPGTGGGGPTVTSTFVSSEGLAPYSGADNPNGYIRDLKIRFVYPPHGLNYGVVSGAFTSENTDYTKIDADLNKGVGGPYIYLTFTRDPSAVFDGNGYGRNVTPGDTGPVRNINAMSACCFNSNYSIPSNYSYITCEADGHGVEEIDLNVDAGGLYIYASQSKDIGQGSPIEVGVLSGNSSSILPPTNWVKIPQDLNEGAGGDFIYFCYKRR